MVPPAKVPARHCDGLSQAPVGGALFETLADRDVGGERTGKCSQRVEENGPATGVSALVQSKQCFRIAGSRSSEVCRINIH